MKKRYTRWLCLAAALWLLLAGGSTAALAQTILFVPQDDRPVSLRQSVDTALAAGFEVLTPPAALLAGRGRPGDSEALWAWLRQYAPEADALVLSADSLIYGGLVDSRTHQEELAVLQTRLQRLDELQRLNPVASPYVFATVMRTPRATAGGMEPAYYEQYGPRIFALTALQDKEAVQGLTGQEKRQLARLLGEVPPAVLRDWLNRREKNFRLNQQLVAQARAGTIRYLLLGRDDTAPFSQTHREARALVQQAQGLPASRFASFPGADQLGLLLLTRAIHDLSQAVPVVAVQYAPGAGAASVPTYEDQPLGPSIAAQVAAAGGIVLPHPRQPDLVLAVHTSPSGRSDEAEWATNGTVAGAGTRQFVAQLQRQLGEGRRMAVGDVSFANGADNSLLALLEKERLLHRLAAYSGWNTPSNTLGYAIAQGLLAARTGDEARERLLGERYLDDWAYQANIRGQLYREVIYARGGSLVQLDALEGEVTAAAQRKLEDFTRQHLYFLRPEQVKVRFPWNRMFEIDVQVVPLQP